MSEPFVIKVQKSIATDMPNRRVMMNDSSYEVTYQCDLTEEIDKLMPAQKEYFWAILDNKVIHLQGKPLPKNEETIDSYENYNFAVMNP